jgi:hypothetical protein
MHLNAEPARSESSELKQFSNSSKERGATLDRSIQVLMADQSPTGPSGKASKTIRSYSHGIAIPCRRLVSHEDGTENAALAAEAFTNRRLGTEASLPLETLPEKHD